jgi:hypothetical protein
VVIVNDEWGRIEEINSTYVVVKIWDERRMVMPLQPLRNDPQSLARFVLDDPAEISEVLDRMLSTGPHPARPRPTSPGRSA